MPDTDTTTSSSSPADTVVGVLSLAVLAVLLFVNPDMDTLLVWVAGFVVAVAALRRLWRQRKPPHSRVAIGFSAAVLVAWPLDCVNCVAAMNDASKTTIRIARDAEERCQRDKRCPRFADLCPSGEERRPGQGVCARSGSGGIRFDVHYSVSDDGKTFGVSHRIDIDNWVAYSGGVDKPLVDNHDAPPAAPVPTQPTPTQPAQP